MGFFIAHIASSPPIELLHFDIDQSDRNRLFH